MNRPVGIVASGDGTQVFTGMLIRQRGGTSFFSALALRLDDDRAGCGLRARPSGRLRSIKPSGAVGAGVRVRQPDHEHGQLPRHRVRRVTGAATWSTRPVRFVASLPVCCPPSPAARGGPSWPGADIARGVALRPRSQGGYVVDLFGALHPFSVGSGTRGRRSPGRGPTFGGDAARGVALMPDGKSGYVLDLFGGLHRFSVGSGPLAPVTHGGPIFYVRRGAWGLDPPGRLGRLRRRPLRWPAPVRDRRERRALGRRRLRPHARTGPRSWASRSSTRRSMTASSLRAAAEPADGDGRSEGPRRVIAPPSPARSRPAGHGISRRSDGYR